MPLPLTLPFLAPLMGWIRTNPRNIWLIAGLVAALGILLFVYLKGREHADAKNEAARKVEIVAALESDAAADMKSDAVARQHAELAAQRKEELVNAVSKVPDSVPDAVAVATGCLELCEAGRAVADLPACASVADQVRTCPIH